MLDTARRTAATSCAAWGFTAAELPGEAVSRFREVMEIAFVLWFNDSTAAGGDPVVAGGYDLSACHLPCFRCCRS
jgi:hypothetical protein